MEWSTRRRTMPMTPAAHRQVPDVKLLKYLPRDARVLANMRGGIRLSESEMAGKGNRSERKVGRGAAIECEGAHPMWELILKVKPIASVSQLHSCVSQMKDTCRDHVQADSYGEA
eukprot:582573-Pleurochrysis_carterae.AAC.1